MRGKLDWRLANMCDAPTSMTPSRGCAKRVRGGGAKRDLSGIRVAAANGGRTTGGSAAAPRVAPVPSAIETPAVLRRHRKNPIGTAAIRAFVTAISQALTSNTYGIAGGCTPSDGGVVFTNAKKQARLVPAPEFARLAAAYGNAPTEQQKNALVSAPAALALEVPTSLVAGMMLRKRLLPAALDPVQDKAEATHAAAGGYYPLRAPWRGRLDLALMSESFSARTLPGGRRTTPHPETVVLSATSGTGPSAGLDALRSALCNAIPQRTRRLEASSAFQKRWEQFIRPDVVLRGGGIDTMSARCALLPSAEEEEREDAFGPEPGAHVCVFLAARGLALGSTSKNALGLCYLGTSCIQK